MINILSIRCSPAFAPYLIEAMEAFVIEGYSPPRVVRQAANGLAIRADKALILRHQNSEATFGKAYAKHYLATVRFRSIYYDIALKSDEVVFASLGNQLFLSHPQSQMTIEADVLPCLIKAFHQSADAEGESLPDWLTISGGDGRLLLSDGRNGRWVLLGSDHFEEFQRRLPILASADELEQPKKPPVILVKGIKVHLQSVLKLTRVLQDFAELGEFTDYADVAPTYSLCLMRSNEGIKITDSNLVITITQKEARKWAAILQMESERLNLTEVERGGIATIFADSEDGQWILQMGDEVLIEKGESLQIRKNINQESQSPRIVTKTDGEYYLILEKGSGGCVALLNDERKILIDRIV